MENRGQEKLNIGCTAQGSRRHGEPGDVREMCNVKKQWTFLKQMLISLVMLHVTVQEDKSSVETRSISKDVLH